MNQEETITVSVEDGTHLTLSFVDMPFQESTEYFERTTGVKFEGRHWSVTDFLKEWLSANGPHHPEALHLINAATGILANMHMLELPARVAVIKENCERVVFSVDVRDFFIIRVSEMINLEISNADYDLDEMFVSAMVNNADEYLNKEIIRLEEMEDYEKAAMLRDTLAMRKEPLGKSMKKKE